MHGRLDGLLYQVVQLVGLRTEWPFGDVNLSLAECVMLFELADRGELAQQEIADALRVDKSRASRLGSVMEERGWIERVRDPANRRVYRIRLTPDGERVAERAAGIMHERHAAVFDALTDEERAALLTGLTGLTRVLREHPFGG
ncbi:MarR family winged helix-turn-helix transcriptional regulator [Actinophytocola sp.]|uniref:MarR family winged helix-turn-helix transcriptional regulator n=1 Tax=Actinophytocola sp. TaxID=1872138 RepID=UPI0025C1B16B|nr:MarR family transcriptional regulator [Actinophytocola sp.]